MVALVIPAVKNCSRIDHLSSLSLSLSSTYHPSLQSSNSQFQWLVVALVIPAVRNCSRIKRGLARDLLCAAKRMDLQVIFSSTSLDKKDKKTKRQKIQQKKTKKDKKYKKTKRQNDKNYKKNSLWIKFVSDGSVQKAGFSASFMKE